MKFDGKNLEEVLAAQKRYVEEWVSHGEVEASIADFSECQLRGIDFSRRDLSEADFSGCYLIECKFNDANLHSANFRNATLEEVEFKSTKMTCVDFENARIDVSIFEDVSLYYANFHNAQLMYTDINHSRINDDTCLCGLRLHKVKNMPYVPMVCPEEGEFIGWKACDYGYSDFHKSQTVIVKLRIPADAKRSSALGRKCRASKAEVLAVYDLDGNELDPAITPHSFFNDNFMYHVGAIVEPTVPFEENRWEECAPGIHFFINRREAIEYVSV